MCILANHVFATGTTHKSRSRPYISKDPDIALKGLGEWAYRNVALKIDQKIIRPRHLLCSNGLFAMQTFRSINRIYTLRKPELASIYLISLLVQHHTYVERRRSSSGLPVYPNLPSQFDLKCRPRWPLVSSVGDPACLIPPPPFTLWSHFLFCISYIKPLEDLVSYESSIW